MVYHHLPYMYYILLLFGKKSRSELDVTGAVGRGERARLLAFITFTIKYLRSAWVVHLAYYYSVYTRYSLLTPFSTIHSHTSQASHSVLQFSVLYMNWVGALLERSPTCHTGDLPAIACCCWVGELPRVPAIPTTTTVTCTPITSHILTTYIYTVLPDQCLSMSLSPGSSIPGVLLLCCVSLSICLPSGSYSPVIPILSLPVLLMRLSEHC